jgi:hypothetical protein
MRLHEDMDMDCTISGRAVNNEYHARNKSTWRTVYYLFLSYTDGNRLPPTVSVTIQPSVPTNQNLVS